MKGAGPLWLPVWRRALDGSPAWSPARLSAGSFHPCDRLGCDAVLDLFSPEAEYQVHGRGPFFRAVRLGAAASSKAPAKSRRPALVPRMLDRWGNVGVRLVMGQVERGHAGGSLFWEGGQALAETWRGRTGGCSWCAGSTSAPWPLLISISQGWAPTSVSVTPMGQATRAGRDRVDSSVPRATSSQPTTRGRVALGGHESCHVSYAPLISTCPSRKLADRMAAHRCRVTGSAPVRPRPPAGASASAGWPHPSTPPARRPRSSGSGAAEPLPIRSYPSSRVGDCGACPHAGGRCDMRYRGHL